MPGRAAVNFEKRGSPLLISMASAPASRGRTAA
jgi:hypothetical protein